MQNTTTISLISTRLRNEYKLMMKYLIISVFWILTSCKATQENKTIFMVAAQKVDCTGVMPQKCYYIKIDDAKEWTYFYDEIEGFQHEKGFEYILEVEQEKIENPPADGSSIRYKLIKIVSKKASH